MTNENQSLSSGALSEPLKELLHRYEGLCKKLETLPESAVQDADSAVAEIKAEFESLPELKEEYAEIIRKRFADAEKAVQL